MQRGELEKEGGRDQAEQLQLVTFCHRRSSSSSVVANLLFSTAQWAKVVEGQEEEEEDHMKSWWYFATAGGARRVKVCVCVHARIRSSRRSRTRRKEGRRKERGKWAEVRVRAGRPTAALLPWLLELVRRMGTALPSFLLSLSLSCWIKKLLLLLLLQYVWCAPNEWMNDWS